MKYVIWGAGYRGKVLLSCMERNKVLAFVDKNIDMAGQLIEGIKVITPEEYKNNYEYCFAVISTTLWENEIKSDLHSIGLKQYFELRRSPVELSFYGGILPFEEMLLHIKDLTSETPIALLGINLFAIMLYDFMVEHNYRYVYLIKSPEQEVLVRLIKKYYKDYQFMSIEEAHGGNITVLSTDRFLDKNTKYLVDKRINFYHFRYLSRYRYRDLTEFYNCHIGERCFVVGNGPSVQMADLEKLYINQEICLGMNEVYKCFSQTKWRPKYYFIEDGPFNDNDREMLSSLEVEYKFVGDTRQFINDCDNLYVYHVYRDYYEEEGPEFSSDINYGTYNGHTILYSCLQFAVYMGFSEIYVIGADCEYKSNLGGKNYFYNYDEEEFPPVKLVTEGVFRGYRKAREYAESHDIKLYNATRGGRLEVLERVSFDELFK